MKFSIFDNGPYAFYRVRIGKDVLCILSDLLNLLISNPIASLSLSLNSFSLKIQIFVEFCNFHFYSRKVVKKFQVFDSERSVSTCKILEEGRKKLEHF